MFHIGSVLVKYCTNIIWQYGCATREEVIRECVYQKPEDILVANAAIGRFWRAKGIPFARQKRPMMSVVIRSRPASVRDRSDRRSW